MTRYLLISGPPGSGKDLTGSTIAAGLGDGAIVEKFAAPLVIAARAFGFLMDEDLKEDPCGPGGVSRREFQIQLSESFAKPLMGTNVFGQALVRRVEALVDQPSLVIVTDSGFYQEAATVCGFVGSDNVRRIHLHREGHDYSNDSRTDWDDTDLGIKRGDLVNLSSSIAEYAEYVEAFTAPWVDWLRGEDPPPG